jgi:hypothetical protein
MNYNIHIKNTKALLKKKELASRVKRCTIHNSWGMLMPFQCMTIVVKGQGIQLRKKQNKNIFSFENLELDRN